MTIQSTPTVTVKKQAGNNYRLSGRLIFSTLSELLKHPPLFIESGVINENISIDCSAVTHLDSAGIALLLEWKKMALLRNKEIVFNKLPKQAKAIIHAAHLSHLFATS